MSKRPFLVVGLASFLSALVCSYLSLPLAAVCLVTIPVGLGATALIFRHRRIAPSLWMAAIGTAMVVLMLLCRTAFSVWPTLSYDGQTVTVTARVLEVVVPEQPCLVRVTQGALPKGTTLLLWGDRFSGFPQEGDLVHGELQLTAAFDRTSEDGRRAKAAGAVLYAWTKQGVSLQVTDGADSLTLVQRAVFGMRRYVRETFVHYLPKTAAGLCRSLAVGDRTALDEDVADDFRASGMYHLLAVSGLHLSVVTGAVFSLLKTLGLRRRSCAIGTMAAVCLFMTLCGFTASVTRAGVMACLSLSGSLFRRQADGLNSLGLAAFVMLCADPFCVWDLGWQLSFAATLGLLTLFPVWQNEVTVRCGALKYGAKAAAKLSEAAGISLSASLLTLPLTALYFGEVSSVFLLGNLLCVWAGAVLLIGLFAALLLCPLLPSGAGVLFAAAGVLCDGLIGCTAVLSRLPFALVQADATVTAWLFALAAVLPIAYRKGRMRGVLRMGAWMLTLLLAISMVTAVLSRNAVTLTAADTRTPVVLVQARDERGLVVSGDRQAWKEAQRLCERCDVTAVDWLLWLPSSDAATPEEGVFTVHAAHLILGSAVTDASKFPVADDVSVLADGGELQGKRVSIGVSQGAALLKIGGKTVLLCPSNNLVEGLPSSWKTPDCLMVCSDLPRDIGCITPKQTVVYGTRSAAEKQTPLLPPDAAVTYVFENDGWEYTVKTP